MSLELLELLSGMAQLMNLPDWLLAPLQAENFIDALRLHVSEFASGEWLILYGGIKRLLLKDDSGYWEGTYNVEVQSSSTGVEQTILLHGKLTAPWFGKVTSTESNAAFGSPDWHGFLPEFNLSLETEPPEKELPGLAQLTDPEQSRLLIEKVLRENERLAANHTITACTPRILSYKPGSRCTIRYELEYEALPDPATRNPQVLIGKVYRKGSKAQNAYEGMLTLWHSPLADGSTVTIAEPIACLPDLKLMLQTAIPGELSLEDLLKSVIERPNQVEQEKLYRYIRKTAAGLAAFHRSGASYGEHVELGERFADLHGLIHRLNVLLPEFEGAFLPLLERLENLADLYLKEPAVPTHGTFNPEQVLIDGERIGFIDFDDYCMAEPALDVGLFRSAIKDTGMNAPFSSSNPSRAERLARLVLLDEVGDVFLSEYETHAAISRHRVALWEAADYLRNCLHYWIKVKPAEPDTALLVLEQHLQNCQKHHLLEQSGS
ncbi:MAG TPA: phosphotransferase [Anaerolineales bacterium]|nr:phosphotransferase [Anaerolineales bacterium]